MVSRCCLGFLSELVPTSTSLAGSLTASSSSKSICVVLFPVSLRELVFWGLWKVYLWTPLCYPRCYFAFVLPILEYCSPVWGLADECHLQLLERQVYPVARLFHDQSFLSFCHLRPVAWLSVVYKLNSNSNHCLFSELPSASTRDRYTRAAGPAHLFQFEVSRCRTSLCAGCFLPDQVRIWNDLPYTVLTPKRRMCSRLCQPLDAFLSCVFFSFPRRRCLCRCESNL